MVVLVEGLMVFHSEEIRERCHFRVFIDCDEDARFSAQPVSHASTSN